MAIPIRSLFTSLRRLNPQSSHLLEHLSRPLSSSALTTDIQLDESKPEDDDLRSRIFRLRFPKRSATNALQKWVAEGNTVTLPQLRNLAKDLSKSQRYKHALEISEWMVTHQEFELSDFDYAIRIDLMTKVFGVDAAERYFEGLPQSAKTGETCTALLHSYAGAKLIERAEGLFERIKESSITLDAITYNEMMTLYMSVGQVEKVSSVIEELKRQKVSPDLYTYNLWISSCAATLDIEGVRRILDEMDHDSNSNDGWVRYRQLTDIYITTGSLVNSGYSSLVETDKKITQREWITYDFLIILYTGLGNKEKVDRIWKSLRMSSQTMISRNYICILSSYLMLGHSKESSEVLEQWKQSTTTDFNGNTCNELVNAFSRAGLSEKADMLHTLLTQSDSGDAL